MRNGNKPFMNIFVSGIAFLPYLWGMETPVDQKSRPEGCMFLPYLWGMETTSLCHLHFFKNGSYRTYEEWKRIYEPSYIPSRPRSYRTYEEWKPFFGGIFELAQLKFLPYLWGMETSNFHEMLLYRPSFLPYLWGMETSCYVTTQLLIIRSYRTYEEWKRMKFVDIGYILKGSYRTYEEWKHVSNFVSKLSESAFLPYLWGMETSPPNTCINPGTIVLTVPMRNGN